MFKCRKRSHCNIVEAIRNWVHFLIGRPFSVIADQQSVSFMYACANHSKVKNEKYFVGVWNRARSILKVLGN